MSSGSAGSDHACSSKMSQSHRSSSCSIADLRCTSCAAREIPLHLCGNCRTVSYCSKQCQQLHWSEHKKLCKLKNPTHFQPEYRKKIQWFLGLSPENKTGCLVRSFKLRCKDETELVGNALKAEEIPTKFLRFLQAAKGARLLPENFRRSNFLLARNEAISKYRICDLPETDSTYSDDSVYVSEKNGLSMADLAEETEENLRILYTVVCGPILTKENQPNII